MANAGDNRGIQGDKLKSYLVRIEKLNEDGDAVRSDINLLYADAKSTGFDTKALRKIIALRKKDKADRDAEQEMLETYDSVLGTGIFG
jgi:uncharacterized protein (UPF0335 family)